jgi:sugar/nucleoside kinase (ribokinase family)
VIDVLVVGGIYRERFLRPGARSRLGGSGLNAAVAAANLGASTALAAAVGVDDADDLRAVLQKAGVDPGAVEIMPGSSATFVIEDEGEVHVPNVRFEEADSPPQLLHDPPEARIVLVFGMPDLDPFAKGLVARWVAPESTLIWDRQGSLSLTKDAVAACGVVARSRIYLANVGEASQEAGGATSEELVKNHPLPGFDYALLKNGRWGTTILTVSDRIPIPAFRVPVVSTIGSGDVFAGALAAGISFGDDLPVASTNAAAAAAVAVSKASPLLDSSSRSRIETIVGAGNGRYLDPVRLSSTTIFVDVGTDAAVESTATKLREGLRNLGLRDVIVKNPANASVVLRSDRGRIVAEVSSSSGRDTVELGKTGDVAALIEVIAERVEREE